jgi:hypothetical protein
VDVDQRQRREPLGTARSNGAATGLITPGIDVARAALAGGAELVEPGADVFGSELGELLLAEAGDAGAVVAGGESGVGVPAEGVDAEQYVRYTATLPCAEREGRPRLLAGIFSRNVRGRG